LLNTKVTHELRKTFEQVAKLALQGSAEAGDDSLNAVEKATKAHSRITLIIDDAMRGLGAVNELMFKVGVMIGADAHKR
jgi:hypothetical protein